MEISPAENEMLVDQEDVEMKAALPILPDEVWLKIFGNLSKTEDIFNATLVCKKWNDFYSNSAEFVENIRLKVIIGTTVDEFNINNFKITRKYQDVSIKDGLTSKEFRGSIVIVLYYQLLSNVATLGNCLKSLNLENSTIRLIDLVNMLSSCCSIEYLYLWNVSCEGCDDVDTIAKLQPVALKFLKNLHVQNISEKILNFMGCTELDKLFINENVYEGFDCVIEFLNRMDRLDNLYLNGFVWCSKKLLQPKFR